MCGSRSFNEEPKNAQHGRWHSLNSAANNLRFKYEHREYLLTPQSTKEQPFQCLCRVLDEALRTDGCGDTYSRNDTLRMSRRPLKPRTEFTGVRLVTRHAMRNCVSCVRAGEADDGESGHHYRTTCNALLDHFTIFFEDGDSVSAGHGVRRATDG